MPPHAAACVPISATSGVPGVSHALGTAQPHKHTCARVHRVVCVLHRPPLTTPRSTRPRRGGPPVKSSQVKSSRVESSRVESRHRIHPRRGGPARRRQSPSPPSHDVAAASRAWHGAQRPLCTLRPWRRLAVMRSARCLPALLAVTTRRRGSRAGWTRRQLALWTPVESITFITRR